MKCRSSPFLIFIIGAILMITACSSGGGGGTQPDPGASDRWDQMEWDKGTWAE